MRRCRVPGGGPPRARAGKCESFRARHGVPHPSVRARGGNFLLDNSPGNVCEGTMRWLTIVLLGLLSTVLAARAASFSSSCDRFEIDGNAFGPHDGTIDFADDFDDSSLAPSWSILLGSAAEAGTDVTAHDPGTGVPLGPTPFQISTVENVVHEIADGGGDFTMTSLWEPVLP